MKIKNTFILTILFLTPAITTPLQSAEKRKALLSIPEEETPKKRKALLLSIPEEEAEEIHSLMDSFKDANPKQPLLVIKFGNVTKNWFIKPTNK